MLRDAAINNGQSFLVPEVRVAEALEVAHAYLGALGDTGCWGVRAVGSGDGGALAGEVPH